MYPEYPGWESRDQGRVTWEGRPGGQQVVSQSPAGTVDQELGRDMMMSRDVTRDSETDFTLDSEQSTTEEFTSPAQAANQSPAFRSRDLSGPIRAESESPEPSGFRFERTGPFYKSTRFRESDDIYRDYQDSVSPGVDHIPEKYFVTVSGFEDTGPSLCSQLTTSGSATGAAKPRNVTEV